ncbi:hypothetical protein JK358_28275 [Nocardia sp. 2]|uniref:Histidine kinase/HSP90-like ATPase domain-containing protein n=1 Tax=Nocardia acididurans TaxID=2802282 RepID=A0ABS1MDZ7_9NOCA|nr:ATP-binding protein [Nocardia acididurans]MBL1078310.1 hypothetical protein [Nocardia acididurans]
MAPDPAVAAGLRAARRVLLERYRKELQAIDSPLTADERTWTECSLQGERIIADCATAIESGRVVDPDHPMNAVFRMSEGRSDRGIRPHNSVRAGMLLVEIVLAEAAALLRGHPGAFELLELAAATLNRGVHIRLEAGAKGHDSFLLNEVRAMIDADRRKLARDIHDRIGNSISLAMRRIELAAVRPDDVTAVPAAVSALTDAMFQLSALTTELRGSVADGCLRTALAAFVESMRLTTPSVAIRVNGVQTWADPEVIDEVFLILRECLRNAIAHAEATTVTVNVDIAPYEISAMVQDDGKGFDPGRVVRNNGLSSITERAEIMSGVLAICSGDRKGTQVSLRVPIVAGSR